MPQQIRVLNWNVEQYGPRKAGMPDIVDSVARTVIASGADIFVMLEVRTTKEVTAGMICRTMLDRLRTLAPNQFLTCVMSPNTDLEFYAFFIRDVNVTTPLVISGPLNALGRPPDMLGAQGTAIHDATFQSCLVPGVLVGGFPLISPDMQGTGHHLAPWTGLRYPALALFRIPGGAAGNEILPLITCHFAANAAQARNQIRNLQYFSLIDRTANNLPERFLVSLKIDNWFSSINYSIVTGDFNVDYSELYWPYAYLLGPRAPDLGGDVWNYAGKTYLASVNQFLRNPGAYPTTADLATSLLDNFLGFVPPAGGEPFSLPNTVVIDIPEAVANRHLHLNTSVQYYAELESKGLSLAPPSSLVNFCRQINLPPQLWGQLDMEGALVGANLISDHLPVLLSIRIN